MPDELSDEELGIPEGLDPNIRAELRKSRQLSRENESLAAKNAQTERELAFARAGIPDNPLVAQLSKTYEGPNDPEAVKAYFEGLGVDLGGSQTPPGGATDAELEEQRRLAQVGSQGAPGGDVRFEDAIRSTQNKEELMALIASAPEGAVTRSIDGQPRRIGVPVIE
jgi:hypothetical protein